MKKSNPKTQSDVASKITAANQEKQELQDKLARSLADYANLEKRIENQRQFYVTLATVSIVSKMIDVLDDLYLTFAHLPDQGLKMTIDKFVNVLQSEGLAEINSEGQDFDPAKMECIDMTEGQENKVISVKKRGYTLNDQVIRPSQVVVGKPSSLN
jgi:molecular chaperone GrpE